MKIKNYFFIVLLSSCCCQAGESNTLNESEFIYVLAKAGDNGEIDSARIDGVPLLIYYLTSFPRLENEVTSIFDKYNSSYDYFNEYNYAVCQFSSQDGISYFVKKSVSIGISYSSYDQVRCLKKLLVRGEFHSFKIYYESISKLALPEDKIDLIRRFIVDLQSDLKGVLHEI